MATRKVYTLLSNTGTVGKSNAMQHGNDSLPRLIQAFLTGTGTVSGEVLVEGSNVDCPPAWVNVGVITLAGTNAVSQCLVCTNPWIFTKATLTAISGTNATISVNIST